MSVDAVAEAIRGALVRHLEDQPEDPYLYLDRVMFSVAITQAARAAIAVLRPVVSTVEELDALPDDAAVLVDDVPARKHMGDWYFANDDGDGYESRSLALSLPAVVLWTPETGEQP